jgi:uncharacterized protein (TIRG00374 family)
MRRRSSLILLGCAASVVFLYLAVRHLDVASMRAAISGIRFWPWLPLGALSYLTGHVLRGFRCRLLTRREARLGVVTAANVVVVGYAANNVFPARLGELVRAGMLSERTGMPVAQSLMITFIERVLDGLAIVALLVFGVLGGGAPPWVHELARIGALVFGGAFAATILAVQAPAAVVGIASRLGARLPRPWPDRVVRLATSIVSAGSCLRAPRDAAWLGFYSLAIWVLEAGLFVALLPAFGLRPAFDTGAVVMSITNLGLLIPSTPGFIGPFHFFCARALVAQGTPQAVAVAYAAVVHLTFFIPVTLWGAIAMLWYGVEVGTTATVARAARFSVRQSSLGGLLVHDVAAVESPRPAGAAPEFVRALVESLVTTEHEPVDTVLLQNTADFVHGQLHALPQRLSLLFETGMLGFRVLTRLRFLRGYCDLSLDTRQRWTSAWADSPYALLRKLFKPLRATALLAHYEARGTEQALVSSIVRRRAVSSSLAAPAPVEARGAAQLEKSAGGPR